jgi:ADP-ribose pyrophosphatase YjhB (NUDIX family)
MITPFSTVHVSAGAILIMNNKILLVREKGGYRKDAYGIPGGRTNFGETIDKCAERELFEEANIVAKFRYILHFR